MHIDNLLINNKTPAGKAGVLLFILLLIQTITLSAQVTLNDFEHNAIVNDINGRPFVNPDIDASGSAFFIDTWKYGKLKVNDNAVFGNIRLRLDLKNQEVHFLKSDNIEMVAPAGTIKEITIFDSALITPVTYTFQCGFPVIDNQTENNFYQVICSGKVKLLKASRKVIREDKNDMSGEVTKEFRLYEDYYLYYGISIKKIKKDKSFVLDILRDQKDKIEEYATKNNLGYKSIDDLRKIIDYYNSLPSI